MLVIALLLLAAYGGPATSSASFVVPSDATTADVNHAQDEVTVQFLTYSEDDEVLVALDKMAEAFRQSDPQYANVTIQYTAVPFSELFPTIETAVAAGA
jgi:ABC-type glycerol-3-phosphate transport system substrate-binding protein